MKRLLAPGLLALSGVLALPGCATYNEVHSWFLTGDVLTYTEYLSVDQTGVPAPTPDYVLKKLGDPLEVHDRNGVIRSIDYHCYSLNDDLKIATFTFDENQKLVKKELW
jgi:hypothetical protein